MESTSSTAACTGSRRRKLTPPSLSTRPLTPARSPFVRKSRSRLPKRHFPTPQLAGTQHSPIRATTASRLRADKYRLSPDRAKEWELARLFVRLFRSLDALWGHDDVARTWLASPNLALGTRPRDLLTSIEGLVRVVDYLDAARGRV